jgi:outer membrane biosynthesis protein TonB
MPLVRQLRDPRLGALALAIALAACSRGDEAARADSALARDLALANQQPTQAPYVFQDTAPAPPQAPEHRPAAPRPTPAPARTARRETPRPTPTPKRPPTVVARRPQPVERAPRPTPEPAPAREAPAPAPGPSRGTIGAGTSLALATDAAVCTMSNRVGDKLTATLRESVRGANGAVIPAGSTAVLEVASIETGDPPENSRVTLRLRAVDVNGESYDARGSGSASGGAEAQPYGRNKAADQKKVIGGAVAGAILGQVLGRDTRSTVIGAAAGAAAGTVAAKRSGAVQGCFPAGAAVRVTLDESVAIAVR